MKVLLDTNILIPLEDTGRLLEPALSEVVRLCDNQGVQIFIHPAQEEDIQRDRDEARRELLLSRIPRYAKIPNPPELSDEELASLGWRQKNDNDRIDNLLLQALRRGAVHLLVTNDAGIHRKSGATDLREAVFRTAQFLAFLRSREKPQSPPPSGIQEKHLYELDVHQPFFESLRRSYPGFNKWYQEASGEHRTAWCVFAGRDLKAICIHKIEGPGLIDGLTKPLNAPAIKLCTFKVDETARGRKLGERLLYTAFRYARDKSISYVYMTAFGSEQQSLIDLCRDYGFEEAGINSKGEAVLLKQMMANQHEMAIGEPLSIARRFYPSYIDDERVSKFIVPIRPSYHERLFPDISDYARGLFGTDSDQYSSPSNTIKKAYLCHSKIRVVKPGDVLLFYRSDDRMSIEAVGVVEMARCVSNIDELIPLVAKRTVFSDEQLEQMLETDTLVILFRLMEYVPPIERGEILHAGVRGQIQTVRKITHEQYQRLVGSEKN